MNSLLFSRTYFGFALALRFLLLFGLTANHSLAQTVSPPKPASAVSKPASMPTIKLVPGLSFPTQFEQLEWAGLTPVQKLSLHPLATSWKSLSDDQKRKWISLTSNFPKMSADEQSKLTERMAQWAALSPRQRELARLNFAEAKKIAPDEKNEKWRAYQALSVEEKQKLAKAAQPKPPRTALAAKPAASGQISVNPAQMHSLQIGPQAFSSQLSSDKTLLVRPVLPTLPVSAAIAKPADPVAANDAGIQSLQ